MSARKIVVEGAIADEFVDKLVRKTSALKVGDPRSPTRSSAASLTSTPSPR
jgi:acyl-CoA reductase-like NAD-dependent aldehyde dehydrogenase